MNKTTKVFIVMLTITIGILIWAFVYTVYFNDDYGVIDDYTPVDWFEENQLYQDEFYNDQNPNAKM